jgi:hypothetical protein
MYMALFIVIIRLHLNCCFLFKLVCEHQCKISGADDTLWTGGPGNYTNPKAPTVFSKVRNLVDNGQYAEATAAAYGLSGEQTHVSCYVGRNKTSIFQKL